MAAAVLILRRTLAERQLIGGEGQKPLKNSIILEPWPRKTGHTPLGHVPRTDPKPTVGVDKFEIIYPLLSL